MESLQTCTTIFVGNPGTGKSTLLNSFFGTAKFRSGVSIGQGLTVRLQKEQDSKGYYWADTPGLSDQNLREQAAKEISAALKLGGSFRICFVCLLDAGRLRPDDKVTMSLVIEAAKLGFNEYAIILNKIPAKTKKRIETTDDDAKKLFTMLNDRLPGTQFIYLNALDEKLTDEENVVTPPCSDLKAFLDRMSWVKIDPLSVTDIKADKFEAMLVKMQEQLEKLQQNNKELQNRYNETVEEMKKAHAKQMEQAEEYQKLQAQLNIQLEEQRKAYQDLQAKSDAKAEEHLKEFKRLQDKITQVKQNPPRIEAPQRGFLNSLVDGITTIFNPMKWFG